MKHNLVNFNHLPPPIKYRAGYLTTLKILALALSLSFHGLSSAQTISFTGATSQYLCDLTGYGVEMTCNLAVNPCNGSGLFYPGSSTVVWQWYNGSTWQDVSTGNPLFYYGLAVGNYRVIYQQNGPTAPPGFPPYPNAVCTTNVITVVIRTMELGLTPATSIIPDGTTQATLAPLSFSYTNGTWYRNGRIEHEEATVTSFGIKKAGTYKLVATDSYCYSQEYEDEYVVEYECDPDELYNNQGFVHDFRSGTTLASTSYLSNMILGGTIVVTGTTTISTPTVFLMPNTRIEVKSGGTLNCTGVFFYSCETWQGIVVTDDGNLNMSGCNINNAEAAIMCNNSETDIDNTEFEDNGIHYVVVSSSYPLVNNLEDCYLKSLISTSSENDDYNTLITSGIMLTSPMIFVKTTDIRLVGNDLDQRDNNDDDPIIYSGIEMDHGRTKLNAVSYNDIMDNFDYGLYLRDCHDFTMDHMHIGSTYVSSKSNYTPQEPLTISGVKMDQCYDFLFETSTIKDCDTGAMFYQYIPNNSLGISTIDHVTFDNCPFGIIAAQEVNPWINTDATANDNNDVNYKIHLDMPCNQFFDALYAISGSGYLKHQGSSGSTGPGASNNFHDTPNPDLIWGVYWRSNGTQFRYDFNEYMISPPATNPHYGEYYDPRLLGSRSSSPNLDGQTVPSLDFNPQPHNTISYTNYCNPGYVAYKRKLLPIKELDFNSYLIISPNPFTGVLNIRNENKEAVNLLIYNSLGILMYKITCNEFESQINTTEWRGGLYFLKVENLKGEYLQLNTFLKL